MLDRREFLGAATALPMLATVATGEQSRLPSTVLDAAKAKLSRESYGDLRIYFDGPTEQLRAMTAGSLQLKPGMVPHPPHRHPEEEFMLITEGSGEITVDGTPYPVAAGSMMYCAPGKLHGITAGTHGLTFYFYKWQV